MSDEVIERPPRLGARAAAYRPDLPPLALVVAAGVLELVTANQAGAHAHPLVLAAQLAIFAIGAVHSLPALGHYRDKVWPVTLGVQAALTALPIIAYQQFWGAEPAFFLASCLLLLRPVVAWSIVAVVEIATGLFATYPDTPGLLYLLIANLTVPLGLWSLRLAGDRLAEVQAARRDYTRDALARQEQRMLRDVHDLLGYSLSAITLKGELVLRLHEHDPAGARAELQAIDVLAVEAAIDLRSVAHGDRHLSLQAQLESARTVLESGGIVVDVDDARVATASPVIDTVLATVVREGVTNVLRHGHARTCAIALHDDERSMSLAISNDGDGLRSSSATAGQGLANLQSRLSAVGGQLVADRVADGGFVLTATVPAVRR